MILRHQLDLAGHVFQGNRLAGFAPGRDHDAVSALLEQIGGGGAQAGGEQAVGGGGGAASLQVSQDGDPGFQAGEFLQLVGQAQGALGVDQFRLRFLRFLLFFSGSSSLLQREILR